MLFSAGDDEAIEAIIYYKLAGNQIAVYADGIRVEPKNGGQVSTTNGQVTLDCSAGGDEAGSNFMDRKNDELHVIFRGQKEIRIKITDSISLSFDMPPMTVEEFFAVNLINNLMLLLGIDESQLKVVHVSRPVSRRRKRATDPETYTKFDLQISNVPPTNIGDPPTDPLDFDNIAKTLADEAQVAIY